MAILRRILSALISLTFIASAIPAFAQKATPTQVRTGIYRGRRVSYQMKKGKMIYQGDIGLDHVVQRLPEPGFQSGTLAYLQFRWPKVGSVYQIPYTINATSGDVDNINAAISSYNATFTGIIQWVPQTTETDWVDFELDPNDTSGVGNSYIGRITGEQPIWGSGSCTIPTLLHEMGHATGLWHEQSRPDSANYVNVEFQNIINVEWSNSVQQFDDMQMPTLYDWSSLMHYSSLQFSKNGNYTHESIPPGMPLSNNVGYSSSDIDGIKRLYQAIPTAVTISTNPAGLQVVVDGSTVTTPQAFNWPLFSTHTLAIPTNAQSANGLGYTYGRWNDNGAASHSITVLPGNGTLAQPANVPAVTVYMASFIQLVPYLQTISPAGAGTVAATPTPQSYPGLAGVFLQARQPVTLTATPNSGWSYYQYINSPYWVSGGLSINPKTFNVADNGTTINMTTYFVPSTSPIYTFGSNPQDSQYYVNVDNGYWPSPISFSPYYYGSSWGVGTTHNISVDPTQWPYTYYSRYLFGSWSDSGAQAHSINLPATSTSYSATLDPQFYLSEYANEGCAGSIGVTPSSPTGDGFYAGGTPLTFSATPDPGWDFTEWQNNLASTSNPANLTMNDEELVTADFNTTNTPLALTSLTPSSAVQGGGNFTLTLNGSGFTSGTILFINNLYRAATFVNANKITVAMTAADLATAGAFQIYAENYPTGAGCSAYVALPFTVASSPIVTPTPLSAAFAPQIVGTTSAAKSFTFNNSSTSQLTINSVTATGDYTIAAKTCGTKLAAGASCAVHVTFTPAVAGAIAGSLSMSDSAPDSPQTVAFTGTGTLPLTIAPTTLAFGTVAAGSTSAAKTVSITNNETTAISLTTSASGNYAISATGTTCGASLAAKAKCNLAVTFSPSVAGAINGGVSIADGTTFSPQLVGLSGTGSGGATAPLTLSPPTLTFANQVVGTASAAKTVTVKNSSASAVTLSSLATSGDFSVVGTSTKPCSAGLKLNPNAACQIAVTFSPVLGTTGAVNGAAVLTDNAAVSQQIVDAKGTAVLPLTFAPTSLTFAAQNVATTSAAQTVTMTNNLATSLSPTIAGNGDFAVVAGGTTPCTGTLATHASCTFTVTFTPSAIAARVSTVTVTDSANPSVQLLNVSGTGQ